MVTPPSSACTPKQHPCTKTSLAYDHRSNQQKRVSSRSAARDLLFTIREVRIQPRHKLPPLYFARARLQPSQRNCLSSNFLLRAFRASLAKPLARCPRIRLASGGWGLSPAVKNAFRPISFRASLRNVRARLASYEVSPYPTQAPHPSPEENLFSTGLYHLQNSIPDA
jgi:hypothetical protein